MQQVSAEWIAANSEQFLPPNDVKLYYYVENPNIKSLLSSIGGSGSWNSLTNYTELTTSTLEYARYCTLDNEFILDNNSANFTTTKFLKGAIGNASYADLTNTFNLVLRFSSVVSDTLDYLTILWGGAFGTSPYSATIEFLNGNNLVGDAIVHLLADNEFQSEIYCNKTNFDSIVISIMPGQKNVQLRVEKIILGRLMLFEKKDIIKIVQHDIIDPNNFTLPTHKLTFELDNTNQQFNPDNPSGIYSYLKEGQEIILSYGLKIGGSFEYINGGVYFLTGWDCPQNGITATFYAGSKLDFMNDTFNSGSAVAKTHYDALVDVINASNVALTWFTIDSTKLQNNCYTSLVEGYRLNEIVQMICNAERILLQVLRDGTIKINYTFNGQLSSLTQQTYTIGQDVSFSAGEYELIGKLKDVSLTYATDPSNTNVVETTSSGIGEGTSQTLKNVLISEQTTANSVNYQIINIFSNEKYISGEFRPDIRLDVGDKIYIKNKYSQNLRVLITELEITYNGAFSGRYKGIIQR